MLYRAGAVYRPCFFCEMVLLSVALILGMVCMKRFPNAVCHADVLYDRKKYVVIKKDKKSETLFFSLTKRTQTFYIASCQLREGR
ncbi:hypothetical protein CSA56_16425 [candidate division KSB3 bacterium]|uniref:Uncharacterized protein n=1 Tax=candidate division KSB3 bacterium TaxID=2044937 RepID=A0A2G6K947_9BACT|nr:MAG: hypothetical protein CSA56_16425 [candidate division KSB3 bacterium]